MPSKLTPDEARDQAKGALALVETGKDPQGERVGARKTLTVSELCDLYLAEGVATKKASTLALDRIRIAGHIKPLIGKLKITEVGSADIDALMNEIASGKVKARKRSRDQDELPPAEGSLPPGSRVRGGLGAASRTVGLLSDGARESPMQHEPPIGPDLSPNQYLDAFRAAALLGLSRSYLQKLRVRGGGPVFSKIAPKVVRYRVGDLLAWAASKTASSTSERLS